MTWDIENVHLTCICQMHPSMPTGAYDCNWVGYIIQFFFSHIILSSIELANMNIFQIFKVHYIPSDILLIWPYYCVQYWIYFII
jgi:hypothetical protein